MYAKGGREIAYSKSSDLTRWDKPVMLYEGDGHIVNSTYPTLVGDEGYTRRTATPKALPLSVCREGIPNMHLCRRKNSQVAKVAEKSATTPIVRLTPIPALAPFGRPPLFE